jgi:hypothetical protein
MDRSTIAEEIYSACDEEFGAPFREEAAERANDLVANFDADRPRTAVQGFDLMRKCYAEIAAKHKPVETKTVPADSGPRDLSFTDLGDSEEFKAGPLEQVAADIAQRQANGTWRAGCFDSVP